MESEILPTNDQGINFSMAKFERQTMYNILNMRPAAKKV